ncbi:unnamed protein product [Cylindrotheca closterium]|uniref:Inward rectifier potassium channel C-terminal domain-containing protein n=1 Tax=Cylindrotheca closterium TaxID=2856 RepID=A0AAD2FPZ3_9STRA|nr:unnamed protein product [Cylindrotheca closterium]
MPARTGKSKGASANSGWKLRTSGSNSVLHRALKRANNKNKGGEPAETTRTATVDGKKVTFSLVKNVTKRPKTSRMERTKFNCRSVNVHQTNPIGRLAVGVRRWLTKRDIPMLTLLYIVSFLGMNAVFGGLFFIQEGTCCEDDSMTYAQNFDFAVQTSSTIGYGGYWPKGYVNNALVVFLSLLSILLSTMYGGLLFFKFIVAEANLEFSEVLTLSNVLYEPCLEIRVGNADGLDNPLINAEASLSIISTQEYRCDDDNSKKRLSQTEELPLAVSSHHRLDTVWTLRHFIDEKSPLYGFRFDEFPATTITLIQLHIKAIQVRTKGEVFSRALYQTQDIMVGHKFEDQAVWDLQAKKGSFDFAKLSSTRPSLVWYPNSTDILGMEK